jgi:hypothetical protein
VLSDGGTDAERLHDLLVISLRPPVAGVRDGLTTWPRCDAECSLGPGCCYYDCHPSRHSAGQPIIVA